MRVSGLLYGGTPVVIKYQAGETMATAGVPVEIAGSGQEGLQLVETTTALSVIGITQDAATPVTAQQAGNATTDRLVSVIINPDAIIEAKLSGGATANTALTEGTEDTGSTDGLLVSTNVDYSSPSFDEGTLICSSGANVGVFRKVTSLSTADAVLTVAFPVDIAVGDKFIAIPYAFSGTAGVGGAAVDQQYVELTTNLDQLNASVTVDTDNVNFLPFRLHLPADMNDATTGILMDILHYDHLYGGQVA